MQPDPTTLDATWDDAWGRLRRAVVDPKHAFRWASLATVGRRGAEARTVVLRGAGPDALIAHTDARAGKAAHPSGAWAEWVFLDRRARLQVRVAGPATSHRRGHPLHAAEWARLSARARAAYGPDQAPGTPCGGPAQAPSAAEASRFAVTVVRPERVDVLRLRQPHVRALWQREGDTWAAAWVVP